MKSAFFERRKKVRSGKYAAVRKLDLKEGLLKGMPVYIVTFFMLFILLILSILYAVTVGSADLSVKQVYDIILYELFRLGDRSCSQVVRYMISYG